VAHFGPFLNPRGWGNFELHWLNCRGMTSHQGRVSYQGDPAFPFGEIVEIKVEIQGLETTTKYITNLEKQIPFATALALTRAPTGNFIPVGVSLSEYTDQVLCPNCDHENSRSFTVLHNLSKSLRNIFGPIPQCVSFSLL
jgi:hypothetical protein